ncbi:MAG TPA: hypothetical protein VN611_11520 [Patescibacteria group bacterium]|nr:hypothetical protein [Patescibacteria group bacterium]
MNNNNNQTGTPVRMCDTDLIDEMKLAVDAENLPVKFSTTDVFQWMKDFHIQRPDGTDYPSISRESLANYSKNTPITKKRKQKVLYTSPDGKKFSFYPF